MPDGLVYNERAWAMDIAVEGHRWIHEKKGSITAITGESGLKVASSTLFPDLLFHGEGNRILLGAELKFPDTTADDRELRDNAFSKASALGLKHTLTWNVNHAIMWDIESGERVKEWRLAINASRSSVRENQDDTFDLLRDILRDLSLFLEQGVFAPVHPIDAIFGEILVRFVKLNSPSVAERIERSIGASQDRRIELLRWWHSNADSWPKQLTKVEARAQSTLFGWAARLCAAHLLASEPRMVSYKTRLSEIDCEWGAYKELFEEMGRDSRLIHLFDIQSFDLIVGNVALAEFHQLNIRLCEAIRGDIDADMIQMMYNSIMNRALRKGIGQFATPQILSRILVALSLPLNHEGTIRFIDPCSGTGNIPFAAAWLLDGSEHDFSITASDRFRLPSTLTMLRLINLIGDHEITLGEVDAFLLASEGTFECRLTGEQIPLNQTYHQVCFNPPFVRQEHVSGAMEPNATRDSVNPRLDGRSDLLGYITCHLARIVEPGGRMGLVFPNSVLSTAWGLTFLHELRRMMSIDLFVQTQQERWFEEDSDVITHLLILTKRVSEPSNEEVTRFVTLNKTLDALEEQPPDYYLDLSASIAGDLPHPDFSSESLTRTQINHLRDHGVGLAAMFHPISELQPVLDATVPASDHFDISRGERRGWNDLFYPNVEHDIEQRFLRPLIRSSKEIAGLVALPASQAFCCSASIEQLEEEGLVGARSWIQRFENERNGRGEPLPEVLERAGLQWYEISDTATTDFVMMMNPDQRHLIAHCPEPAIVDQRLIRINSLDRNAGELCHALLNTSLSYLFLELIGFGRGLGALDLNATGIKNKFRILDPSRLDEEGIAEIIDRFAPLKERAVLPVQQEIHQDDRILFDATILRLYGLEGHGEAVRELLRDMATLRRTVIGR